MTSHELSDDQILPILLTKFKWETASKYMKHWEQPLWGFLENRVYDTLTLEQMLQKYLWISWFLGNNWYKPATLPNSFTESFQAFFFFFFKHFKELLIIYCRLANTWKEYLLNFRNSDYCRRFFVRKCSKKCSKSLQIH